MICQKISKIISIGLVELVVEIILVWLLHSSIQSHVTNQSYLISKVRSFPRNPRTTRSGNRSVRDFSNFAVQTQISPWNSALLTEAGQTVPDFLVELESEQPELLTAGGDKGCTFCGGLGHRITECPKLESAQRVKANNKKDYIPSGAQDYWPIGFRPWIPVLTCLNSLIRFLLILPYEMTNNLWDINYESLCKKYCISNNAILGGVGLIKNQIWPKIKQKVFGRMDRLSKRRKKLIR